MTTEKNERERAVGLWECCAWAHGDGIDACYVCRKPNPNYKANERDKAVNLAREITTPKPHNAHIGSIPWCDVEPIARALIDAEAEIADLRRLVDQTPDDGAYSVAFVKSKEGTENPAEALLLEYKSLKAECEKLRAQLGDARVYHLRVTDELRAALAVAVSHSHGPTWCTACDDDVAQCPLGSIPAIAREKERRGKEREAIELLKEARDWLCPHEQDAHDRLKAGARGWCSQCHNYLRSDKDATLIARIDKALAALGDAE